MDTLKEGVPLKMWGGNSVNQLIMIFIFISEIYHFNNSMYIYNWDLSLCHIALLLCPMACQNLGVCRLFPLEEGTVNRDWFFFSAVLFLKSNIKKNPVFLRTAEIIHIEKLLFVKDS